MGQASQPYTRTEATAVAYSRNFSVVPAAYPEQKSIRNVRAHREMVIHIEHLGFCSSGHNVMNDVGSENTVCAYK